MSVARFVPAPKKSKTKILAVAEPKFGAAPPAIQAKLLEMGVEARFPSPPVDSEMLAASLNGSLNGATNGHAAPQTPDAKIEKIEDANAVLTHADLDEDGSWGRRYLVATPEKLLVFTLDGEGDDAPARLDYEAFVKDLVKVESKSLVGGAALEARVKQEGAGEKVVELLRASNTYSKELLQATRQIEHLREHGTLGEEGADDSKWQVKDCPRCARRLPKDSKVCPFCINRLQAMRRLFSYLGPYKWMAIGNGALSVVATGLSFVAPLLTKTLTDKVFPARDTAPMLSIETGRHYILLMILAIIGSSVLGAVIDITRGRTGAFLGSRVLHDVRTQVYEQLQRLSLAYYDKREVGAVMSRVQNDVGMLQNFLMDAAENIIISTLTIVAVVVIMFIYSPLLAVAALLPVPFVIIGTNTYWRGLMKLWRRVWHQNSRLGARLADSLGGVRVVRAFAQENREVQRFSDKSGELRDATMRVERKAAVFHPLMNFIMGLGLPLTWMLGGNQVLGGTLTFGTLVLFTMLLGRLYGPVQQLTRLVNFTTRAMTAAERVFEILDMTPEIREQPDAVAMPYVEGRVEFRDAVFGYDKHRPVLHGVNLIVEPGEMIGLVGHSGAGKSTLINLLMRFYDVDEGAILVDGVDLRDIRRDDVRQQIGVVLQEPYLFHGTIFENIAYGNPAASKAEIMAAAKAAYAHDFIVSFPDGYDTIVGERGTRLSGGERQRISIARAILHNPRILILDEATASVDTQTEQQIQKALKNLIKGRTVFAIAHRLSTLRNANRLVVVEKGKIAETGTHDELIAQRGVFFKLVEAQKAMNEITAIGG